MTPVLPWGNSVDAQDSTGPVRERLRAMNPDIGDDELDDIDWSIFHPGDCCGG